MFVPTVNCDARPESVVADLMRLSRDTWGAAVALMVEGRAQYVALAEDAGDWFERADALFCSAVQIWDWAEALSARSGGPAELRPEPWARGEEYSKVVEPGESDPARPITTTCEEVTS